MTSRGLSRWHSPRTKPRNSMLVSGKTLVEAAMLTSLCFHVPLKQTARPENESLKRSDIDIKSHLR